MPRDASETRDRLIRAAEHLFATQGIHQATTRDITEAAGQRNVSALAYHFGDRDRVLGIILARHGDPLDVARGELLVDPIEQSPTRDLMAALLLPYASRLATDEGRDYLRIVAQLSAMFPSWHDDRHVPIHLRRALLALEARPADLAPARRRARIATVLTLMTGVIAERARAIDHLEQPELDDDDFLADLADTLVAALEAPAGPPLRAPRAVALLSE